MDPSLSFVDEPASNLHSTASGATQELRSLVEKCDLVYTTHSHHLIDVRWLDGAYVVKTPRSGP